MTSNDLCAKFALLPTYVKRYDKPGSGRRSGCTMQKTHETIAHRHTNLPGITFNPCWFSFFG